MSVLATFVKVGNTPTFIERSYLSDVAFTWWNMCVVSTGQTLIVKELAGFGGVKVLIKFKSSFWNWNSSAWSIADIFDDFYAILPNNSIVAPGTCNWRMIYAYQFNNYILDLGLIPNAGRSVGQIFPTAPSDWYRKFAPRNQPNVWGVLNTSPSNIYIPPSC